MRCVTHCSVVVRDAIVAAMWLTVFASVALAIGQASAANEQSEAPSISGVVRDADGNPLSGAHVEARLGFDLFEFLHAAPRIACETTSADDGSYVLAPLPTETDIVIIVTHPHWANGGGRSREPLKEDEHRSGVDIKLAYPETASGTVVDDRWQPIEGAVVTVDGAVHSAYYDLRRFRRAQAAGLTAVFARDCGGLATTTTDAEGRFAFTHLPRDTLTTGVRARKKGYGLNYAWNRESCQKAQRYLKAGKGTLWLGLEFPVPCDNIKIVLKKSGGITGRVVEAATGEPVEDVLVTLEGTIPCPEKYGGFGSRGFLSSARTDASGSYRIDDVPQIPVMVKVEHGNLVGDGREVVMHSGEVFEEIDFALTVAGVIEGTVYNAESGRPMPDQIIQFSQQGVWGRLPSARTDEKGWYRVEGLQRGQWRVHPGYRHEWRVSKYHHPAADDAWGITVRVYEGQTTSDVDLYLEKQLKSSGKTWYKDILQSMGERVVRALQGDK